MEILLPIKLFAILFLSLLLISKFRKITYKHLKSFALVIFLSGTAIYGIGFNEGGCYDNYLALGWLSALSSLEMFTSHSDLIEVSAELRQDPLYMVIFSIIHFLAVCVSAIAIIKLFGYQLYSWSKSAQLRLKCSWNSRLQLFECFEPYSTQKLKEKKLFVLWGVNNNSVTLAESIYHHLGQQALLIFVALPNDNKHQLSASRFTFSHFFHFSSDTISGFIDRLEQMNAILMNADTPINAHLTNSVTSTKEFYSRLQLKNLGSIIHHISSVQEVQFFFLSDNEYENIEAVSAFKLLYNQKDKNQEGHKKVYMYCHARRNSFNENLLLKGHAANCKIEIVDSSLLSVRQLKKDLNCQPVSFVEKDCEKGVVLSPYHALIIGFGEVGRDALRFLYEFASFMGENGKEDLKHFYIADEHLESKKTVFLNSAPALKEKSCIEWWEDAPATSQHFWNKLKGIINHLNHIVICVNNDEEARFLLSQMCDFAYKYRTDFQHFQILIRIKDELYSDQVQRFSNSFSEKTCRFIRIFGSTTSIFNYKVFSTELLEKEAKEFYYQYKYIANAFEGSALMRDYMYRYLQSNPAEEVWEHRRIYKDATIRKDDDGREEVVNYIKRQTIDDDIEVHYQEEQDYSNAWHKYTKCALAGIEFDDNGVSEKSSVRLQQMLHLMERNVQNEYPNLHDEKDLQLMDNLSGCEHLRWAAKMELLGFVYKPGRKSLKAGTNACIVSYADLKANPDLAYTIAYDMGVVELSFNSLRQK